MRNKRWLRYGILTALVGGTALGTLLVACGDDDDGVTPTPPPDGSTTNPDTSTTNPPDSTTPQQEASVDAGAPAKIIIVHAATDLGPNTDQTGPFSGGIRICLENKSAGDQNFSTVTLPPLPTEARPGQPYPGIFVGTGGLFSTGTNIPLDVFSIRPYLMNAKQLAAMGVIDAGANTPRCPALLRDGGVDSGGGPNGNMEPGKGFWQLADIPAGTFKNNKTYVMAVTGCTSNAGAPAGFCGTNDAGTAYAPTAEPGVGNLRALIIELDTTGTVAADEIGAAALNLSPQQEATKADVKVGPFKPTLLNSNMLDGGGGVTDAAGNRFAVTANGDELAYNRNATSASPVAKIKGLVTQQGYFALAPVGGSADNLGAAKGPQKLNNVNAVPAVSPAAPTLQAVSTGNFEPTAAEYFINGKSYTFILVGDPTLNADQGTRRIHYLGFPNAGQ